MNVEFDFYGKRLEFKQKALTQAKTEFTLNGGETDKGMLLISCCSSSFFRSSKIKKCYYTVVSKNTLLHVSLVNCVYSITRGRKQK